jgi:hypothetical protein
MYLFPGHDGFGKGSMSDNAANLQTVGTGDARDLEKQRRLDHGSQFVAVIFLYITCKHISREGLGSMFLCD